MNQEKRRARAKQKARLNRLSRAGRLGGTGPRILRLEPWWMKPVGEWFRTEK